MSAVRDQKGLIYRSPSATLLDTREMEWEPFDGLGGSWVKVLARFDDGEPEIMLVWRPPGPTQSLTHLPYRHYHATVHERNLFLAGDFPHWDYRSADDADGEMIVWQDGYYLDRPPGPQGLHGIEPEPVGEAGTLILMWRTGTGNLGREPNFHEESIEVAYPASKRGTNTTPVVARQDGSGVVYENEGVMVLDTRAMAWQPMAGWGGRSRIKVLSRFDDGAPSVMLLSRAPESSTNMSHLPYRHYHPNIRECFYILSGEFPHWDYESAEQRAGEGTLVTFKAGYFLDRRPGPDGIHGIEAVPTSPVGCVILHWRNGVGNLRGDPNYERESIEVPYPS